jgi:hypothetical protein
MRIYLPATVATLAAALAQDPVRQFSPGSGYAVTPGLREWYASGDTEELEYAALSLAAEASIALIASDPAVVRRRVVVAAEIRDPAALVVTPDLDRAVRGQVSVVCPIPLSWVAAVHVDDRDAEEAVAAALEAPDDEFVAGEAADHELLWYATQELDELVAQLLLGR